MSLYNLCLVLPAASMKTTAFFDIPLRWRRQYPVWWPGLKNSPTVTHACRKRRLKWVPSPWGYIWATLSPGVINTPGAPGWGLGAGLTIQPCKKIIVTKPQKGRSVPELGCRAIWWWWWWYRQYVHLICRSVSTRLRFDISQKTVIKITVLFNSNSCREALVCSTDTLWVVGYKSKEFFAFYWSVFDNIPVFDLS
jgi:hypothetical protein